MIALYVNVKDLLNLTSFFCKKGLNLVPSEMIETWEIWCKVVVGYIKNKFNPSKMTFGLFSVLLKAVSQYSINDNILRRTYLSWKLNCLRSFNQFANSLWRKWSTTFFILWSITPHRYNHDVIKSRRCPPFLYLIHWESGRNTMWAFAYSIISTAAGYLFTSLNGFRFEFTGSLGLVPKIYSWSLMQSHRTSFTSDLLISWVLSKNAFKPFENN